MATNGLLYNLPDDLPTVQIIAVTSSMAAALTCASGECSCAKHYFKNHLETFGLLKLTQDFIELYGNHTLDGKQGTNNLTLFQETFFTIVPRAYRGFLNFLQSHPDELATLSSLSINLRFCTLQPSAKAQLSLLNTPGDTLPLYWPTSLESEVA